MSTVSPEPGILEDRPEEKAAPDAELAEGEEGTSRVWRVLRCALPAVLALLLVGLGVVGFAMTMECSPDTSLLSTNSNEDKVKSDESEAKRTETEGSIDKEKVEAKSEEAKQNVSDTPASTTPDNSASNSGSAAPSNNNTSNNSGSSSPSSGSSTPAPTPTPDPTPAPTPEPPAHVHTPVAVTHQVEKYEQQWISNPVTTYFYTCSDCGTHTYSSAEAKAHQAQEAISLGTGYSYYSDSSTVDEGSFQSVFVGYETVTDGYVCSGCGAAM